MVTGVNAVSYTHLDVYKRQLLHCLRVIQLVDLITLQNLQPVINEFFKLETNCGIRSKKLDGFNFDLFQVFVDILFSVRLL